MHIPLKGQYDVLTIGCEHQFGPDAPVTFAMDIVATETRVNNVRWYQLRCPGCERTVVVELERR